MCQKATVLLYQQQQSSRVVHDVFGLKQSSRMVQDVFGLKQSNAPGASFFSVF